MPDRPRRRLYLSGMDYSRTTPGIIPPEVAEELAKGHRFMFRLPLHGSAEWWRRFFQILRIKAALARGERGIVFVPNEQYALEHAAHWGLPFSIYRWPGKEPREGVTYWWSDETAPDSEDD